MILRQCFGLILAVACWLETFGTKDCKLGFSGLKLGVERGIGMQSRDGGCSHEATFDHIPVPMDVTDDTAFSKSPAAGKNRISPLGGDLTQDKRPGSADGGMAGRIGAILHQVLFFILITFTLPMEMRLSNTSF